MIAPDSLRRADGRLLIAVHGVIGAGKTTTTQQLSARMGAQCVLDPFEVNPMLAKFYKDPARFRLATDVVFLGLQQGWLNDLDPAVDAVSDFSMATATVFHNALHRGEDVHEMEKFRDYLSTTVPAPDISFFLDIDLALAGKRIRDRGREMEQDPAFMAQLNAALDASYRRNLSRLGHRVHMIRVHERDTPQALADRCFRVILQHQRDARGATLE